MSTWGHEEVRKRLSKEDQDEFDYLLSQIRFYSLSYQALRDKVVHCGGMWKDDKYMEISNELGDIRL